jgi:hypothetical protein
MLKQPKPNTAAWLTEGLFETWFQPLVKWKDPQDALQRNWRDNTFLDLRAVQPYRFVQRAIYEHERGKTIALLLRIDDPSRLLLEDAHAHFLMLSNQIMFLAVLYATEKAEAKLSAFTIGPIPRKLYAETKRFLGV